MPISWEIKEIAAIDRPMPMELNKKITGQVKEVAANSAVPSLPSQKASANEYNCWIKLFNIIGMEITAIAL